MWHRSYNSSYQAPGLCRCSPPGCSTACDRSYSGCYRLSSSLRSRFCRRGVRLCSGILVAVVGGHVIDRWIRLGLRRRGYECSLRLKVLWGWGDENTRRDRWVVCRWLFVSGCWLHCLWGWRYVSGWWLHCLWGRRRVAVVEACDDAWS